MNREQRAAWDLRHRDAAPGAPEPSLLELLPLIPRGLALDLAAGSGRHAITLARAGFRVIAVDFSAIAMRKLDALACDYQLPISTVVADLEGGWPFRAARFDLIVNINYLDRDLFPSFKDALKPQGILLFDTFLIDQAELGHPRDPRFLLKHWELREALSDLELMRYREGLTIYSEEKQAWRATALARRP